jgi:hypothetical protein
VVFVSFDHEQRQYEEYFEGMPWLSVPYDNAELRNALAR